jgi:enamine deaminase RidA (YjgF/YER057c/UK114 family)
MQYHGRYFGAFVGAVLAGALALPSTDALAVDKERINPPGVFKHPNFTRVITVKGGGKMIFIAGQTPSDMEYKCVAPGDFKGQFIAVMENLKKGLAAAGATFDDVVHRRTYVLDMDKYLAAMRGPDIPRYWNPEKQPASTTVQVSRLSDPCFLIEIDLLAVVD